MRRSAVPAGDIRENLIHALQPNVEIDEPEKRAAPTVGWSLGRDDSSYDMIVDTMSEEDLLRGLRQLLPQEACSRSMPASGAVIERDVIVVLKRAL